MTCLKALLTGLVDYAGLYPPAALGMPAAAENYARDGMGEHAWMLGRFVVGTKRLREFSAAAAAMMPGTFATSGYREHAGSHPAGAGGFAPWRVSVLLDGVSGQVGDPALDLLEKDIETIEGFNRHHSVEDNGLAVIDCVEVRPANADMIDVILDRLPEGLRVFFEVPAGGAEVDSRGLIAAMSGGEACAKIRTGGLTSEAFPEVEVVAAFIENCRLAAVPFKATAGLHHPIRGEQKLTYEKDSPRGVMHGFLNVFLAACFAHAQGAGAKGGGQGFGQSDIAAALAERSADVFAIGEQTIKYKRWTITADEVAKAREAFALSFGSCSFEEPVDDLAKLGLLK